MYRKATAIHLSFLLLILIVPALTFADNINSSPPDTSETQSLLEKLSKSQYGGIKKADLNDLNWELVDAERYSKEQILSGNAKGKPHPFYLYHDTVDVQTLPSVIWLQTTFSVPDSLQNQQVYFSFQVLGAAELYWNGSLLESFGRVDPGSETEKSTAANVEYMTMQFSNDPLQQLSFRINTENIKSAENSFVTQPDLGVRFPEMLLSWENVNKQKKYKFGYQVGDLLIWIFGFFLMILALIRIVMTGITKVSLNELFIGFLLFVVGFTIRDEWLLLFGYDFVLNADLLEPIVLPLLFLAIPNHIAFKLHLRKIIFRSGIIFTTEFSF